MATSQYTIYTSEDAGAPILQGQTGSLVNLLNKILVAGYGNKPAAGWSADFTSANGSGSTYRPPSGSRMYLSVDDNASGSVRNARLVGFEVATSFNSGSGKFPSVDRTFANYVICRKSVTTDVTKRTWICFADAYTVHLRISSGDSAGYYSGFSFGDFYSIATTPDNYNCFLHGSETNDADTPSPAAFILTDYAVSMGFNYSNVGCFAPRNYAGGAGSVRLVRTVNMAGLAGSTQNYISSPSVAYPNLPDNSTWICPIGLYELTGSATRGVCRGEYAIIAPPSPIAHGKILSGSGGTYAGKLLFNCATTFSQIGYEISPTIQTN